MLNSPTWRDTKWRKRETQPRKWWPSTSTLGRRREECPQGRGRSWGRPCPQVTVPAASPVPPHVHAPTPHSRTLAPVVEQLLVQAHLFFVSHLCKLRLVRHTYYVLPKRTARTHVAGILKNQELVCVIIWPQFPWDWPAYHHWGRVAAGHRQTRCWVPWPRDSLATSSATVLPDWGLCRSHLDSCASIHTEENLSS